MIDELRVSVLGIQVMAVREYACSATELLEVPLPTTPVMELVWEVGHGEFVEFRDLLFFAEARGMDLQRLQDQLFRLELTGRIRAKGRFRWEGEREELC